MDPTDPADPYMQNEMMGSTAMTPTMMPSEEITYDVKLKRCIKSGKLKFAVLPPEDFLLDPNATVVSAERGRFFADRTTMTRSDAKLKWPEHSAMIDELPAYTTGTDDGAEKQARHNRLWSIQQSQPDPSAEEIEVYECYVKCDYDGDGVAEWRQVCVAGTSGETNILANEEWGGELPYVSITPNPMPHRYRGRSIFDDVGPIQRIKTVLLRQLLDNLYLVSNPLRGANGGAIENKDALINPEVGGIVWTQGPPGEHIADFVVPPVADKIYPALEYWDMALEKRTGVSRSTMALDMDQLQHQTATAVNAQQGAAHSKVETYARYIAEFGGFKELFSKALKLIVQNQKSMKRIRVRNDWETMDPRGWNADMDVTINVGLGSGSRDRDLTMLGGLAAKQELAIQASGNPLNPMLNVAHLFATYRKMAEATGLKNPEQFFPEVTQEQVAQMAQQMAQNPPPTPEQIKAQAQMQVEQMKAQSEQQIAMLQVQAAQQRDANKAQIDQQAMQNKAQIEKLQADADIATNNQKVQAEAQLEQKRFELERELKILEFRMKMAESRAKLVTMGANTKTDPEGNQVGPDPSSVASALQEFDAMPLPLTETENGRRDKMTDVMGQLAQALQQFAAAQMAPTEIVRDPTTGRAVGAQKRLN